jgi:predicted lipoprotein with Yx(FWY)xxD motif
MSRLFLSASFVVVALVAACNAAPGATTAPTTAPQTAAPTVAPTAAPTLAFTVALAPGGFFVGPDGKTLYSFDKDTAGVSNCQPGQCLDNWPPLLLPGGVQLTVGAGLSASNFAFITRADGGRQVTFKDVPLYYFAGDQAVGDKNGDGIGGVWHLATKDTVPVAAATEAPSVAPTTGATTGPTNAPSSAAESPEACFDNDGYQVPCTPGTPGEVTVSIASDGGYLVSATGMTLYTFDKDTTENSSACTADCLGNWPALTIEDGTAVSVGEGLDVEDFTTFTRADDGTFQVAYYAKPLYMFAGDSAPGDTNGDGVAGVWHLAMPQ